MQSESELTPVKRLFNILKEEKNQVYAIYFYAVLNGLITLSLPLGIQAILNFIFGREDHYFLDHFGRCSCHWRDFRRIFANLPTPDHGKIPVAYFCKIRPIYRIPTSKN